MVRTSNKGVLWTFWGPNTECFFFVKREMPILLFVKCEMTNLFPVKRDQYPPLPPSFSSEKCERSGRKFQFSLFCSERQNSRPSYSMTARYTF